MDNSASRLRPGLVEPVRSAQTRKSSCQLTQCEKVRGDCAPIDGPLDLMGRGIAAQLAIGTPNLLLNGMFELPVALHFSPEDICKRQHSGMLSRTIVVDRGRCTATTDEFIAARYIRRFMRAAMQVAFGGANLLEYGLHGQAMAALAMMGCTDDGEFRGAEPKPLIDPVQHTGQSLNRFQRRTWIGWTIRVAAREQHAAVSVDSDNVPKMSTLNLPAANDLRDQRPTCGCVWSSHHLYDRQLERFRPLISIALASPQAHRSLAYTRLE